MNKVALITASPRKKDTHKMGALLCFPVHEDVRY